MRTERQRVEASPLAIYIYIAHYLSQTHNKGFSTPGVCLSAAVPATSRFKDGLSFS